MSKQTEKTTKVENALRAAPWHAPIMRVCRVDCGHNMSYEIDVQLHDGRCPPENMCVGPKRRNKPAAMRYTMRKCHKCKNDSTVPK